MSKLNEKKQKPWRTPKEQVEHLKSKGVRFALMSEADAEKYLAQNNNYFRLRSYRTSFGKVEEGPRKGQYANLDFKMLVDLSIIDMLLRNELLPMTLDIEHFAKVNLLQTIEQHEEDGYAIVQDFFTARDHTDKYGTVHNRIKEDILRGKKSPYVAGLVNRHSDWNYPVWGFIEVIAFGAFLDFYKFCAERFDDGQLMDNYFLMQCVRGLRNACAHNNCILNDLKSSKRASFKPRYKLAMALGPIDNLGSSARKSKLQNERFCQIATTLYLHKEWASSGIKEHRGDSLHEFANRMNKHLDYYKGNQQVTSSFEFIGKIIDAWYMKPTEGERAES